MTPWPDRRYLPAGAPAQGQSPPPRFRLGPPSPGQRSSSYDVAQFKVHRHINIIALPCPPADLLLLSASNFSSNDDHDDDKEEEEHRHPPRPLRPPQSHHHRSMSHPFPSLFSNSKKKKKKQQQQQQQQNQQNQQQQQLNHHHHHHHHHHHSRAFGSDLSDSSSSDEFAAPPMTKPKQALAQAQVRGARAGPSSGGGKDAAAFKTGNCMTCNALVRWPRDLAVYKCSICATINHVQPLGADRKQGPVPAPPISLDETRTLLRKCLRVFLSCSLDPTYRRADDSHAATSSARSFAMRPKPLGFHVPNPLLHEHVASSASAHAHPLRRPPLLYARSQSTPSPTPPLHHHEPGAKHVFKLVEDYIATTFTSFACLNSSFLTPRSAHNAKHQDEPVLRPHSEPRREWADGVSPIADLDPRLLLLGDFAENGSWWTGNQDDYSPARTACRGEEASSSLVTPKNPRINWSELSEWYTTVVEAARPWRSVYNELTQENASLSAPEPVLMAVEALILAGQDHLQRTLLKATETMLKRPGFYTHPDNTLPGADGTAVRRASGPTSGQHSGIIKRIFGLLSNAPHDCQSQLTSWLARYPEHRFVQFKDLAGAFLAYRLLRQYAKKTEVKVDVTDGLIPSMSAGRSAASLHAALGQRDGVSNKKAASTSNKIVYQDDWQIKAAAHVMSLLFAANNSGHARRSLPRSGAQTESNYSTRDRVQARGQVLATSDFYTTLLDDADLVADFEAWESRRSKFAFCQYPFLLSIGAKIHILEHDAKRQMQTKARDAFFDSIMTRRNVEQFLSLHIRRDCLVDDSLKAVSEVIGSGGEDIKKGLRIVFIGEEGVDAGGLRKEWFLLLVREVFSPDHGMFTYDEESQYCYFNPASLEPSEQFFLVGVVFGLAIYNSTILDVALPPFLFRKLLVAAPVPSNPSASTATSLARPPMTYSLDDLAEFRPTLANGLRSFLEYDGDVETTFCLDFVIETDRREYVDLYVRYLLDTAVARQFEPFKRGFFTVCGGNALSLFRPEEIELLVRGSDEPLDISSLRMAAAYDNWDVGGGGKDPVAAEPTLAWFWQSFERASPRDQRRLLLFITGSDRIPALGAASLCIRIACLGDDCGRFPTARTCFNVLALWRYRSRERLEGMLWTAVNESEGFGLK
ncbi:hypothetical protein P8C59_000249 [Phyllachora maydis]|uniref:HECT-type E3 ubiquitin transferase n=1 Tax=Phyllachora maydis TaxID=1825666 RepID=A0AAD9HWZ6_9PEZI|nr:hypothetical protein P8C59_000249 [Phyllachora maydis]